MVCSSVVRSQSVMSYNYRCGLFFQSFQLVSSGLECIVEAATVSLSLDTGLLLFRHFRLQFLQDSARLLHIINTAVYSPMNSSPTMYLHKLLSTFSQAFICLSHIPDSWITLADHNVTCTFSQRTGQQLWNQSISLVSSTQQASTSISKSTE